jgi:hypothetical protein
MFSRDHKREFGYMEEELLGNKDKWLNGQNMDPLT